MFNPTLPLLTLAQTSAEVESTLGDYSWIYYLVVGTGFVVQTLRKWWPKIEAESELLRESKVDNFIIDLVADFGEGRAADAKAKKAAGEWDDTRVSTYLKELGSEAVEETIGEFGDAFLGSDTKKKITRKIEKHVGEFNAKKKVTTAAAGN